ncbi:MAG: rubrerythrin family protein [Planctomycetaceae bacterium]|nr:rubrerythrin family protein [Planctomycetaceae bacterium]
MQTDKNLKDAFAGESQASRRYIAFARKADIEGLPNVARLFRAAAEAETIHALAHLDAAGEVGPTAANLKAAIKGEGFEFEEMYPKMVGQAKDENNAAAARSFENALLAEEIHHGLYSEALRAVEQGKDLPTKDTFVCRTCGNTGWGEAPDKCPVCGSKSERFFKVL